MMNIFILVNIIPTCTQEIVYMIIYAFSFQKELPYPLSFARNRLYLGTHLKEELSNWF